MVAAGVEVTSGLLGQLTSKIPSYTETLQCKCCWIYKATEYGGSLSIPEGFYL